MTPIHCIFFPEKNPFLPIIEMDKYATLASFSLTLFNRTKFYLLRLKNAPKINQKLRLSNI